MPRHERPNPETDPFRPPAIPTEVCCLHCGREYESYLIQWLEELDPSGDVHGFWCCPTPGCDGKGFGFDIFPTDPEYRGEDGEPMWSEMDELEFDDDETLDLDELEAEELFGGEGPYDLDVPDLPDAESPPPPPSGPDPDNAPRGRRWMIDEDDIPF